MQAYFPTLDGFLILKKPKTNGISNRVGNTLVPNADHLFELEGFLDLHAYSHESDHRFAFKMTQSH